MKNCKAVWMAVILSLALMGCGAKGKTGSWNADTNSIYVKKDMAVESAMVYTSEKDNEDVYNQDELKAFVEESIIEYNTANGGTAAAENSEGAAKLSVALKSCAVNGKAGILVFEYAGADDYVKFNEETFIKTADKVNTVTAFSVKNIADAQAAGELAEGKFVNTAGKAAEIGEVTKQEKSIVVAVEGAAVVHTEGQITYVSEGVTLNDTYTAATSAGTNYIIFQ